MLTISQEIAKRLGKKDSVNTWFGSDINHPNNIMLKLESNVAVALGCVSKNDLPQIIKENITELLPNTFSLPLDKK